MSRNFSWGALLRITIASGAIVSAPMAAAIAPPIVASADSLSQAEQKLKQDQQKQKQDQQNIAQLKQNIQGLKAQEVALQKQVDALTVQIDGKQLQVDAAQATLNQIQGRLQIAQGKLTVLQTKIAGEQAVLSQSYSNVYQLGLNTPLNALLSSGSFGDLWERIIGIDQINSSQESAIAQIQNQEQQARQIVDQIAAQKKLQAAAVSQLQLAETELQNQQGELQASEAQLAAVQAQEQQQILQNEQAEQDVGKQIIALETEIGGFKGTGQFMWPLEGHFSFNQPYGCDGFYLEGYYDGCDHFHTGVDIAQGCWAPVYAADSGTAYAYPWYDAWGNYIVINHNNGYYSLYGHLYGFAIRVTSHGVNVLRGQLIGYEGTTGNSNGCHVHFQIMNSNGDAINPCPLLGPGDYTLENGYTSCSV